jgi:pyruvate ferredoxin oxidoreductase gamma subunit
MFRIRLHGRGGQGIKTAGRMLGSGFFLERYEVQDAPLYGAERRGAPVFAYVRAARAPILERGVIRRPGLVVVADDGLIALPAAGVLNGVRAETVLLVLSATGADVWQHRLNLQARVITLAPERAGHPPSATCAGAAARLTGVIGPETLERAVRQELEGHPPEAVAAGVASARHAYGELAPYAGLVPEEGPLPACGYVPPDWVTLPVEGAEVSAPAIHRPLTSLAARTGLWRTLRPVIDYGRCRRCWWVCSGYCPDGAIAVEADGTPRIDYEHCKGCLVCLAQCPPHAIEAVPERELEASP